MVTQDVNQFGLGRLPYQDPQSANYQIRTLLQAEEITKPRSYTWANGVILNQGSTGTCVGHAGVAELGARPVKWPATSELAFMLYELCTKRDVWPDNDNGNVNFGTSVLALMKVLKGLGFIPEYRWAGAGSGKPLEDYALTLGYKGCIINGTVWYNSMFNVTADGHCIVDAASGIAGGHAYTSNGIQIVYKSTSLPAQPTMSYVDLDKSKDWFINSWGNWGYQGSGRAWTTLREREHLMYQDGEQAVPIVRQRTI